MITRSPSFAAKWLSALLALLLVLGQFTFYTQRAAAADNLSWTALNNPPLGGSQQINDVIYGGGRFVAVSQGLNNRQIVNSVDGVSWTNTTNDLTTEAMIAVAYGGGIYIAVGNGGVISRSTDGVNWSKVAPSPTSNSLTMVKYLNGKFWAVGVSGTVMSSTDGQTWSLGVYPDVSATNTIIDIDYKDGKYAVGDSNGKVYFSTTGATGSWGSGTSLAPAQIQINYLSNLNGIWFAIDANGKVYKSNDGSIWSSFTLSKQVFGAAYGNGTYVIYSQSGGSVFTSTDASTWTEVSLPSGATWYGITYGNDAFILVGNNGYILRSTDGANWTTVDPTVNQAIHNNGLYVAVGNNSTKGTIMSSTDGVAWTSRYTTDANIASVAYGNNRYAAVGTGGKIYTSADGISWTPVETTNTTYTLSGIRYVNEKFMAVGASGTLVVSTDGTTWTTPGSTGLTGNLFAVAYANGKYVISGAGSSLWHSSDGASWTKGTGTSGSVSLNDVIYAGNQFVAVGASGSIYTSPDGAVWTSRSVGGTATFNSLAYENGMYIAVGTLGTIYSSRDGVAWTAESSNVSSLLRSVHYDGSRFYAIGAYLGITTAAYGATSSAELQTAEADGAAGTSTSTKIDLTFDADVAGLTDADITITNGTGAAVKGALTGSGKNWSIALSSVTTEGDVSVAVASPSGYTIGGSPKTVAVYKASAGGGSGSTFTVVNTNDSGTGSLRWAIAQAGAVADGKVVFDPALAGQTIKLESDLTGWDIQAGEGTTIGNDSTNFTLTGLKDASGMPAITVDGNGHAGIRATGSSTFSLSDIRFTNFDMNDIAGQFNSLGSVVTIGGYNYNTVNISNVQFDHNKMTSESETSIVSLTLDKAPYEIHMNRVVFAENELHAYTEDKNTTQAVVFVGIDSKNSEIANSLFYNNKTKSNSTGGAYGGVIGGNIDYNLLVVNNTFYGNNVSNEGTGGAFGPVGYVFGSGISSADFYNNVMIGNTVQGQTVTTFDDVFHNGGGVATTHDDRNLYVGNPFINVTSGDFRLSSPATEAIDLGDDSKSFGSLDLAGKARKVGSAVDIGAYEYVPGAVSDDASLTSVLGQTDNTPGSGSGINGAFTTWSINVPNNVTKLVTADILPADSSARIWFYEDSDYAGNDGFGIASLNLPEGGSATAYIQIDSGSATRYYAVTINRAAAAAPAYTINGTSQPWQDATLAADGDVLEITTDDSPASAMRIHVTAPSGSTVTLKGKAGKIYDKVHVLVDEPITLKLENFNIAAPAGDAYNGIGFVKHNSPGDIVLEAAGSNTIEGFNGIFSDSNHQLMIKGTGTLTAKGRSAADPAADSGNGIYMTSDNTSGNTNPVASLAVDGSVTVKAYGGDSVGASGGSGIALNWGNLLIKSGDVEAYGGKTDGDRTNLSAGSGVTRRGGAGVYLEEFGSQGQAGKLTVEGGSLKTVGGEALAENVRGDYYEGGRGIRAYHSVVVSGGTVLSTGGASASQRGGDGIFTPKLDISSAATSVTANGGNGGTSATYIEAGSGLYVTNDIVIDGSTVTAAGGQGMASEYGIFSPSGSLTIKRGADVTASGGNGAIAEASGGPAVYTSGNIAVSGSSRITATGGNGQKNGSHGLFSFLGQISINDNAAVTAIGGNGTTGLGGVGMRAYGNGNGNTVEIASDAVDVYVRGGQGASATRPAVIAKDVWIAAGNVGPIAMEGTGNPRSIKNQSGGDDVYLVTVTTNPAAATSVFSQVDGTLAGNYTYKAPTLTDGLAYMWLPSGTQTVGAAGYQNKTPNVATDDTASAELTPLPAVAHLKHGSMTTDFTSIQAALDASADGDTVTIEAGTYRDQLTVTKNITLQGAGIGQTIIESPNSDELVAASWKTLKNQTLYPVIGVKTSTSGEVVIKDLTIDGRKQGYIGAHAGDASVYTFNGIAVRDTSATIDQVKVIDVRDVYTDYSESPVAPLPGDYLPQDQPSGANHNESILLEGATGTGSHKVTVQNSEIVRFHKTGILAWGPTLEVDIHDNKLQGHGKTLYSTGNGIQIASSDWSERGGGDRRGTTGIVKDNEIYDFGLVIPEPGKTGSYLNLGLGGPTGILLYQAGDGFVIEGNTITGPSVPSWHNSTTSNDGGYSNDGIGFTSSKDLTIRNNTITGFGTGILEGGAAAGSTIEDNTFGVNEIDIWTLSGDDTIKMGAGAETIAYNRKDNGIDTIEGFGTGDRLNVIGFVDGSVNAEIGTTANAVFVTETGGAQVINGYTDAHPVVDFTDGSVTAGDGTNVAARSVEVSVADGVTTLYIDTEGDDDAAELVIKLAGVYVPGNFKLNGGYISYATLVPADGLTVTSSDPTGASNDGKTKIDATPVPATGHKLVYYNFGMGTVTIPNVGDTLPNYEDLPSDGLVVAENGDKIGVAEVDADGKVVHFGQTSANVTAEPTPTQATGLTVTSTDPSGASNDGKTKIDATPAPATGHKLVYYNFGTGTVTIPNVGDTLPSYEDLPNDGLVVAENGDKIGVAEVDADGKVVHFGQTSANVTAEPTPTQATGLTVTSTDPSGASNDGKTKIDATPAPATGHKLVYYNFGTGTVTIPNVGDTLPSYEDLPSDGLVVAANGDNLGVAEVDAAGKVVHFGQTPAVSTDEPVTPVPASGLTVTSSDPTGAENDGKTKIHVAETVPSGHKLVYINVGTGTVTVPNVGDTLSDYEDLPSDGLVVAANGDNLGVAEVDAAGKVVHFGQTPAVSTDEPVTPVPASGLTVTSSDPMGAENDSKTKIEVTETLPDGHKLVYFNFTGLTVFVPNVGDTVSGYTDLPSDGLVAAGNGDKIGVYEVDAAGKVIRFGQTTAQVTNTSVIIPEMTPAAAIAYSDEALTGLKPGRSYKIDGVSVTADSNGKIKLQAAWIGKAISVVKVGNGTTTTDSVPQTLSIPSRPAAPNVTADDIANAIAGLGAGMEFAIDSGSYVKYDGTNAPDLTGTHAVLVRVSATESALAGAAATLLFTPDGTYNVLGTVVDDAPNANFSTGATVKVMKGNDQIGSTATTDANGHFKVTGVPNGTYNLIVTKGDQIITVAVTVKDQDYDFSPRFLVLPRGNKNSALVIKGDTPSVVVDGLNDLFADTQHAYTADDQQLVADGGSVKITLGVEKQDAAVATGASDLRNLAGGQTFDLYLDMTLTKTRIDTSNQTTSTALSTVGSLLKIIVPFDLTGKTNVTVYRYHDGAAQKLTQLALSAATPSSEGYMLDPAGNQIIVWAQNFSTYAVAYGEIDSPPGPVTVGSVVITASADAGGSISPAGNVAVSRGGSQTFTITPDKGYVISDVTVDGKSVGKVGSYAFSNVTEAHTIKAVFAKEIIAGLPFYYDGATKVFIGFSSDASGTMKYIAPAGKTVEFQDNRKTFADIASHWGKSYIDFVAEREIFLGVSDLKFAPNAGMTRAMLATVIGRLYERSYGPLAASGAHIFTDADYDSWYGAYLDWAASSGIIQGVGGNRFEPDRQVTRQEMAVMLYRFAQYIKADTNVAADGMLDYSDAAAIEVWARQAVLYGQQAGIFTGRGGNSFVPKETATRAEVAAILQRFIETIV